jgi:cbb3-type cytochrome oxidase subunit 3
MTAIEFSLVSLTVSFIGMVVWVYWPSRRELMESYASMPLDDDDDPGTAQEDRA